jgi:putative tricarboxylic transport membrane protein
MLCVIGCYASEGTMAPVYTVALFGVVGYVMKRLQFPVAPLILGVLLGPMAEENLRRSLLSFEMDWTVFFTRPICLALLALAALTLVWPVVQERYQRRVAERSGVPATP